MRFVWLAPQPDERLGETVAAAVFMAGESHPRELVELDASAGGSMARIGAHAKANLAHFKVPRRIFQWPAPGLPRGATGKLLKNRPIVVLKHTFVLCSTCRRLFCP